MAKEKIWFDMDGTIADFYGVDGWLADLEAYNVRPYAEAKPLVNMQRLARRLNTLQKMGYEIGIISWLSKDSTEAYKREVRKAKRCWLNEQGFPYDVFHGVQYGATKADSVREVLREYGEGEALLIDDSAKVRKGWTLGEAIDPNEVDIIEFLRGLL
jgi:phosphoserine phosphatase